MTALELIATSIPLVAAITCILALLVIVPAATDKRTAVSFGSLAICLAGWNALLGLECIPGFRGTYPTLIAVLHFPGILLPAAIFHSACVCAGYQNRPSGMLIASSYVFGLLLCALQTQNLLFSGYQTLSWGSIGRPGPLLPLYAAFVIVLAVLALGLSGIRLRRATDPVVTLRTKYWLLSLAVALPFGLTNFLVNYGVPILPLGSLATISALAILAYAATTHKLVDPALVVLKVASVALVATTFLLPVLSGLLTAQDLPIGVAVSLGLGSIIVPISAALVLFPTFRAYVEQSVESSLFPARHSARVALREFSEGVVTLPAPQDLCHQLVDVVTESVGVSSAGLYLSEGRKKTFRLSHAEGATDPPRLLHLDDIVGPTQGDGAPKEHPSSASVVWETFVPVMSDHGPEAVIALGSKLSGAAIDDSDLTLLSMVAAQLSVALKNIEYVHKIEQQREKIDALRKRVEAENVVLRAEVRTFSQFDDIIGASGTLRDTLDCVLRVAPTNATILITGETGTGKELIARAIHDLSPRSAGPLISVNCPAIPVDIAESELFGHERGAFTGAIETYPGKFEMAHGGTIFLDEVADLPANIQTKLLRVLQERQVQRLGSHKVHAIDVRIVAATNRDLQDEIRRGRFREDLYFRLASVPVHVPPLRERTGDISMLAAFFLDRAARRYQKAIEGISPEALNALTAYNWPGNIRELQHVIERAVLLCTSNVLQPEHLSDLADGIADLPATLGDAMREEKLRRVREALFQTEGNQAAAARLLGMSRSNLARLIKRYGIDPLDFVN